MLHAGLVWFSQAGVFGRRLNTLCYENTVKAKTTQKGWTDGPWTEKGYFTTGQSVQRNCRSEKG